MISFQKEQVFIVTGASSGIGEGITLLLNELGASVVAIARNEERLLSIKSKAKHPENIFVEIKELTENINELPKYIKELKNKYGKFSGLVCSAGIGDIVPLQVLEYEQMRKLADINYYVPIFMAKGFADRRNNVGEGASIIFISSISAHMCNRGLITYAGMKGAIKTSGKAIARELSAQGIRVNIITPSEIETPIHTNSHTVRAEYDDYPFGLGSVEDVANMAIYLLSDKAKWLSCQEYIVDCGVI